MSTVAALLDEAERVRARTQYRDALATVREAVANLQPATDAALAVRALVLQSQLEEDVGDVSSAELSGRSALRRAGDDDRLRSIALTRTSRACGAAGRPDAASELAQQARALASAGDGSDVHTEALVACGLAHLEQSRLADAATDLDAAVSAPASEQTHARALLARATLLRFEGLYDEALRLLDASRPLIESAFGARSLEAAALLNDVGVACKFSGRFERGRAAYLEALDVMEATVGLDHPDAAAIFHNLGGLEHARRDPEAAEPWARRSVRVRTATLGAHHPDTAADRVALAGVLVDLARLDEAEQLLHEALETYESAHGPVHYEIGVICGSLGSIAQRRGELAVAHEWHSRALDIKHTVLGTDHPELAITLNNLGVVARRQGDVEEAVRHYERAISILEAATEPNLPTLAAVRRNLTKALSAPT